MKPCLIISAFLLGTPCRYDGRSVRRVDVASLEKKYTLIPICPEVDGGLPTPRTPSERIGDKVIMRDGRDVTDNYRRGAERALNAAVSSGAKAALLKSRSPSCGKGRIYDGTFSGTLTDGDGVTAELLIAGGIAVYGEEELDLLL